jgi:hypothetical protein
LLLSIRYGGLTGHTQAYLAAHEKTLHTQFTKNDLTETYFCNEKQQKSKMAEGVFLNSGMQRLAV